MRLLPLALLLVACTDVDPNVDDTDRDDTDAGDTDTTGDTDDEGPIACPKYTGLDQVGREWTWRSTDAWEAENDMTSAWTSRLDRLDVGTDAVEVRVVSEGSNDVDGLDAFVWTTTIDMRCDADGVWLLHTRFDYTYTIWGVDTDGSIDTTYTTPDWIWKRGAGAGASWQSTPAGTIDDSENGTSSFSDTIDWSVLGQTQTTVPAGTFTTLEVESVSANNGTTRSYADRDVGLVLQGIGELVAHDP